ncbi:MAG: methyl-accepting chemotaxis protein [Sporolactobacillus sp.]|jgi:methyl-accepting chemotaxis protein|nr:methyl-accepting chemotaxis protein [Sporolactobacillus sp.]
MDEKKGTEDQQKNTVKSARALGKEKGHVNRTVFSAKNHDSFFNRVRPKQLLANVGITGQLLIPFAIIVILVGVIAGAASYLVGSKMTRDRLAETSLAELNATDKSFDTFFEDAQSVVGQFSGSTMLKHPEKNKNWIAQSFQNVLDANTKYQALTYGAADKTIIRAPLYFFGAGYDPTKDSWYRSGAANAGEVAWTDPYVDSVTKQPVVSITQAVMDNKQVKGVVKIDLTIQSLVRQVNDIKFGRNGYAVLLDKDGHTIAGRDGGLKGIAGTRFYKRLSGSSGSLYAKIGGKEKHIFYERNKTTGWILVGIIDESEIAGQAHLIALPSIIGFVLMLLSTILVIHYLIRKMVYRLNRIKRAAKKVENGNLRVLIPVTGHDELADLARSLNEMAKANRESFGKLSSVAEKVAAASQSLVASAEENVASANEISATVTQIASGASDQSSSLDKAQASVNSLAEAARKMDDQSKNMLDGAGRMSDTSINGAKIVKHLSQQSQASAETTGTIIRAVKHMQQHAKSINQVIDVLDSIARRTNLLSLNASIEAAHAGEEGKGFAVVASEIRKLAQQTNRSLQEVTETIHQMTEETAQAVELCERTSKMTREQTAAVEETGRGFKQIGTTIESNVRDIRSIAEAIRRIQTHIDQINRGTQSIAATSEETAASTEEVSASVQEQTAAMEELNKLAGDLDRQAQLMHEAMEHYKL